MDLKAWGDRLAAVIADASADASVNGEGLPPRQVNGLSTAFGAS
jgi:hypothetical protein